MKTVVIYKSKSGYTKKYAEWIAEELNCDIKENKNLKLSDIKDYDTIIYGGGLYATMINGIDLIKKNFQELKGKNIIVYATGSNPGRAEEMNKVWEATFTEEQRNVIHKFYLRGGFDYSKLSFGNKILMSMLKKKLQSEKNPTEDEKDLLKAYDEPIDFTNKDNKKVILIENRKEDMILNEIYENKIIESFIISKANDNNLVNNICNESTYYFGIDDDYIKNLNVRKIQIENKLISYIDDEMKDKTLDYLCVWGMIV